jgi:predicted dinucleotide-binding enzyme
MKIGTIGAGNVGGNLTRRLSELGHEVSVANSRGPETLTDLATETGASAVPIEQVARDAEIVVVAIPERSVPDLPTGVLDGAAPGAGRPTGSPDRRALPIAGDDPAAKQTVIALLDELGFDAVDAGSLDESWRQEPGTPVYGASADADGVRQLLAQAEPAPTAEWRA